MIVAIVNLFAGFVILYYGFYKVVSVFYAKKMVEMSHRSNHSYGKSGSIHMKSTQKGSTIVGGGIGIAGGITTTATAATTTTTTAATAAHTNLGKVGRISTSGHLNPMSMGMVGGGGGGGGGSLRLGSAASSDNHTNYLSPEIILTNHSTHHTRTSSTKRTSLSKSKSKRFSWSMSKSFFGSFIDETSNTTLTLQDVMSFVFFFFLLFYLFLFAFFFVCRLA